MRKENLGRRRHKRSQTIAQISRDRENAQSVPRSFYWWPITDAKIHRAARKIAQAVNPEKIILFGSFAYGKPTPDSDVDLLVIMESDLRPHARVVQISDILDPRPFPVDIIVRTLSEIEERLRVGDCFFREVLSRGRVLYERASR